MAIKYFKCIKTPEDKENNTNMFISYTFYSSSNSNGYTTSYSNNSPLLTLGGIYHTDYNNSNYIFDDASISQKLDDVMQYLEPFEWSIDELSQKVINNKNGDEINICPMRQTDKYTSYLITVSTITKSGRKLITQTFTTSIYNGLIECYRRLRTRNDNYNMFYSLIHEKIYPVIRTKKKKS